ncbi:ATP synthase subunit g, mitochondrial [Erysiphe necator]|nr:ATP synthase subunit g, mitochondrial [Erysiphe necator]
MSVIFSRSIRPCNNLHRATRNSIARFGSTDSQFAKEVAKSSPLSTATAKATDSLSRAASAAGPALKGVGKTLGSFGGKTGEIMLLLQHLKLTVDTPTGNIPTTVYYARVGLELSKLVIHGRNMIPPPISAFQSYFQRTLEKLRNPSSILTSASLKNPQEILQRARNLSSSELAAGMVLFAELLGFFTVGEIIGRFKLIGYKGEISHHH